MKAHPESGQHPLNQAAFTSGHQTPSNSILEHGLLIVILQGSLGLQSWVGAASWTPVVWTLPASWAQKLLQPEIGQSGSIQLLIMGVKLINPLL